MEKELQYCQRHNSARLSYYGLPQLKKKTFRCRKKDENFKCVKTRRVALILNEFFVRLLEINRSIPAYQP